MRGSGQSRTTGPYWKTIGYGSLVGTAICVLLTFAYQSFFAREGLGPDAWPGAVRYGVIIGAMTSLFVVIFTLPTVRLSGRRKGAFVALATLGPLLGWIAYGAVMASLHGPSYFTGYPIVGGITAIGAGTLAALAMFVISAAQEQNAEKRD
ncbi:hypothetical protein R2Q81_03990 [Microbacterium aquimaris]|uniref:hypothetical protein n=1 Tax=Microbacterium aquimaris TaxID=459816 RepID=UPI002AD214B6|nr:hypothetical protein [Microbacterium aquimaris]MDZ8275108.1 hypothetical protein [Microbacterium aquimaris]